jgi:hypothetical protein
VIVALLLLVGVTAAYAFSSTHTGSGTGPAPPSAAPLVDAAPDVVGTWLGTYRCAQGRTGLRLTVAAADGAR